jgi:PHD/YefM family antitoxin component YafN of YafNO toxin-antitoxin module
MLNLFLVKNIIKLKLKLTILIIKMTVIHESEKPHKTTYVTISKDEYDRMKSTLEILADKELMEMIKISDKEFKEGKGIPLKDFLKGLDSV